VRARTFATMTMVSLVLCTIDASAALDPKKAEDDAKASMSANEYAFCSKPTKPLSRRALGLCPMAKDIPNCAGLVAACEHKEAELPKVDGSFLKVLARFAEVLIWIVVAGLAGMILYGFLRAILGLQKDAALADRAPPSKRTFDPRPAPPIDVLTAGDAEALLRRAEAHAARGERGIAVLLYLGAALRALDRRGEIRIARDRTNGEYVRSCKDQDSKRALREIVNEADAVQFGGSTPDDAKVKNVASRAVTLVRALPLALLVLVLCACGGPPRRGADPAGDELFRDLLVRQGVVISPQRGPLQALPLPKEGEKTIAMIVDAERVPLDDETAAHLVEWVRGGGVLLLAGRPSVWPKELVAKHVHTTGGEVTITSAERDAPPVTDEDDEPIPPRTDHAHLAYDDALQFKDAISIGTFPDGSMFVGESFVGRGHVIGMANDDLFTNAALARPGNAAAVVAILAQLDRNEIRLVRPEDGTSLATNPITALVRAGLGLGLVHALFAIAILFLAVGVRMSRPVPTPPPPRRAFSEHVAAMGALWARCKLGTHALAAYAKHVDERIRARMPRNFADPATFLAARAKRDPEEVAAVWKRATTTRSEDIPIGDELAVLKELRTLYVNAKKTDA